MSSARKAFILFAALALTLAVSAFADDAKTPNDFSFFTISLVPRILAGNGGPGTDSAFSVNVLAGERASLTGFEIAWAVNIETGNVVGFQVAGLANVVAGDATGFQASPGVNATGGYARGFQLAGLVNIALSVAGLQASPGVNIATNRFSGLQLGLVNIAEEAAGLQFGVVNIARLVTGLSLGLVTIEEGGIFEAVTMVDLGSTATIRAGIGLRVGTKSTYSAFFASMPVDAESPWTIDAGWGVRVSLGALIADAELSWRSPQAMEYMQAVVGLLRGSAVIRASMRIREVPLFIGVSSELLIAGVSPEPNGELAPSARIAPGFFLGTTLGL